jgi:hypothetical protein
MAGFFAPDDVTAVPVLPTPAAVGTPGFFTVGSLTTPATVVSQDFLNGIVVEIQNLATVGGIPLSKTTPTVVPNIIAIIAAQLTGYVRKSGDVMTGNLTLGTNYGTTNNTPALVVQSGATSINFVMNANVGGFNTATQLGDTLIYYTDGTVNTGALMIGPWGSGTAGGIRLDNTGAATFSRPVTMNTTLTLLGSATGTTRGINDNSLNLATTAFLAGQAGTLSPIMDGTASVGSSIQFARQDHVHPTDTTRVQQGGGIGQGTNKLYLGWSGAGLKLTVDTTDEGVFGMLPANQTWTGINAFANVTANAVTATGYDATTSGQFRANQGNTDFIIRNDGNNTYFLISNSAGSSFNTLRPLSVNMTNGFVNVGQQLNVSGPISTTSSIDSTGNITANNGYIRANFGWANNHNDSFLCPIMGDFTKFLTLNSRGGPTGYQFLPGGMIMQWGQAVLTPGTGVNWNYPITFPSQYVAFISITPVTTSVFSNPPAVRGYNASSVSIDTAPSDDLGTIGIMVWGY